MSAPADARSRLRPTDLGHPVLVALVAVAAAGALAARFVIRSPLWLDEALSVNIARLPIGRIPEALRHDGHPPLYYVLLHGWMLLVGTGDHAVRLLSGLISLAALPLAYRAGRRVGGARLGWTTVAVFALSPYYLRFGSETRMYSLVMFLVLGGFLLLSEALDPHDAHGASRPRLAGIAAVTGALLWTHYWSMWLLGATGLLLLIRLGVRWRRDRTLDRTTLRCTLALGVGGLTFVPWLPSLAYQSAHTGTPWAPPFRPSSMVVASIQEFAGGPYSEPQVLMFVMVVLLCLGIFGRGIDDWRVDLDLRTQVAARVPAAVLGATMAVASVAGIATHSAFAPRYASIYFPFFALLVALGLDHFRGRAPRNVAIAVFLVLSLVGLAVVFRLTRTEAGAVATRIERDGAPGAIVVTCPDQLGPSVRRAVPQRTEVVTYPDLGSPERVDWVDYEQRNRRNDPDRAARALLRRAGGRTIYAAINNGYLTFGNQCAEFISALGRERHPELLLDAQPDRYFEAMTLYVLPPTPTL